MYDNEVHGFCGSRRRLWSSSRMKFWWNVSFIIINRCILPKARNDTLHSTECLLCSTSMLYLWDTYYSTWVGHIACMGERRGVYRVLVRKPEGKRPLGRPRYRWEDNIMMDLQEVGWVSMDWIDVAQDRYRWWELVNVVMNLQVV